MDTEDDVPFRGNKVFTTGQAATLCRVSQQTIIRCFDAGKLKGFVVPMSTYRRIPRPDLIRFMRENNIPTDLIEPPTTEQAR